MGLIEGPVVRESWHFAATHGEEGAAVELLCEATTGCCEGYL